MNKTAETVKEEEGNEADFLGGFAGMGMEDIDQNAVSNSYLAISQDLSEIVLSKVAETGKFYNSATQQVYGEELKVIPLMFKVVWDEKDDDTGRTVARHAPQAIQIEEVPVPVGKKGYPKWINPATGNEVIETYAYALILADHLEDGFLLHTAGLGSKKTYRKWNKMLVQTFIPGTMEQAPLFSKIWTLKIGSKISTQTNKPFFALTDVIDSGWAKKDLFMTHLLPARKEVEKTTLLLAAPPVTDAVETEVLEV